MQRMFDAGCTVSEYSEQGRSYPFPALENELCPICGRDYLRRHGYYGRYIITADFDGLVEIRRYICLECGKTVSLLPSFAHPGRTYGTEYIMDALWEYSNSYEVMNSVRAFSHHAIIPCSRQLLRWFMNRISENLKALIMEITEIYNLRSPPVTEIEDKKRGVRQFLERIRTTTLDTSLKIFERSSITYLTPLQQINCTMN